MNITIEPADTHEPTETHEGHWLCTPTGMTNPEVCMRARVPKSLPLAYGLLGQAATGGYVFAVRVLPGADEETVLAVLHELVMEAKERHVERLRTVVEFERIDALELLSRAGLTVVSAFRHNGGAEVELRVVS